MATGKKPMAKTAAKSVAKRASARSAASLPAAIPSVAAVRGRLGLSRKLFSRLAGFSERAIADWEGGRPVSEPGLRRIKELARFRDPLPEGGAGGAIPARVHAPHQAVDGPHPPGGLGGGGGGPPGEND